MCKRPQRGPQGGASQLELVVSIVLFAVFMIVFAEKAFYYQEYGEKAAMEMTVANMRTGLRYKVADLIMNNRVSEIPTLADENPMDWLSDKPENYLGEFEGMPRDGEFWFIERHGNNRFGFTEAQARAVAKALNEMEEAK